MFSARVLAGSLVRRLPGMGRAWHCETIAASGLFDAGYYLERHPGAPNGFDPIGHYLDLGASEMSDPSPFFRTGYYLAQNPDVKESGLNPLVHFILWGAREGRDPSPYFDTSFYLESNPDVRESRENPLAHFLLRGRREGREPVRRSGPRVHLYATCWNEIRQLGFFFRHYDPVVQRYVIFDDGSTDGSLDLLRGHPKVEIRRFYRRDAESFVLSEHDLFNNCWKESRGWREGPIADWVITCNIDEHLVHADLAGYLAQCQGAGITVIPALGFQMFTDTFPDPSEHLSKTRTTGVPEIDDCKLILFSPTAVQEINHAIGGHAAAPVGRVVAPERNELMLLNYQLLGIEYTLERFAELRSGLGATDRANNWGYHYGWSRADLLELWAASRAKAVDTAALVAEPWKGYAPPSWWNELPRQSATPPIVACHS
jgi:hypothetical protein